MSERDVTQLLERVSAHTPPLDVDVSEVVEVGRRRVRRRRVMVGGVTVTALVAAFWLGQGPGLLGDQEVSPASVTWEVKEETTVDLVDEVEAGGDLTSVTVTKDPQVSSATVVRNGVEETLEGETMAIGADLFVGGDITLMVWRTPPEAMLDVRIVPHVMESSSGLSDSVKAGGVDLSYRYWVGPTSYRPEDIVFHNEHQVWSASGHLATTLELRDGDAEATAFELSEPPMIGVLNGRWLGELGGRVKNDEEWVAERVPSEAVFARQVRMGQVAVGQEEVVVDIGPMVPTDEMPSADVAFFDWVDGYPDVQWSADGLTWHNPEPGVEAETKGETGPVGAGGMVALDGEVFHVALDAQDWPQLLRDDGTVLLSVSDESGAVGDGGTVSWRDGWLPWAPRNTVHFAVGEDPPVPDGGGALEDVVTISGPAGDVTLGVVPAKG